MSILRSCIIVTALALISVSAAAATSKSSAKIEKSNTTIVLNVFTKGCIESGGQVGRWAVTNKSFEKKNTKEIRDFSALWKNLGYPIHHKLTEMWNTKQGNLALYQHENKGCTLASTAMVDSKTIKAFFQDVGKAFEKQNQRRATVMHTQNMDTGVSTVLIGFENPSNATQTYLLARTIDRPEAKLHTIMHYIITDANLSL